MSKRILVVDDDKILLQNLKRLLVSYNYEVELENIPQNALEKIQENNFNCVLLDVRMPGMNGLDLLIKIKQYNHLLPVVMISGQSDINTAVEAIKSGAYDFIEKPVDPDRLLVALNNVFEREALIKQNDELAEANSNIQSELEEKYRMIGRSEAMNKVFDMVKRASEINAKVLITGESGTGKELVAWAIHHNGIRKNKPYIKINCAAIPAELLESELFGHTKGSFTGAVSNKQGKFQAASGGTLFLDEIGDMDFKMQAKILRVLQENEIEVIGETTPIKVDVRIIAATNKNLEKLVQEGKFREDLYHRLNLIRIHLIPLRNRNEDILPMVYFFINNFSIEYNKQISSLHLYAEKLLLKHKWHGNARELKNVIEKIIIFCEKTEISETDVLNALNSNAHGNPVFGILPKDIMDLQSAGDIFEKRYIQYVLEKNEWKKEKCADMLGIDRSNLYKKIKRHSIHKK